MDGYKNYIVPAIALLLMLAWFWLANSFSEGAADPLPYIALINPLELGLLIALAGVFSWTRQQLPQLGLSPESARKAALVIAAAMVINLVVAGLAGTVIPILLEKAGVDPALASGAFVTTVTDVVGFFAFLGFAALYLL